MGIAFKAHLGLSSIQFPLSRWNHKKVQNGVDSTRLPDYLAIGIFKSHLQRHPRLHQAAAVHHLWLAPAYPCHPAAPMHDHKIDQRNIAANPFSRFSLSTSSACIPRNLAMSESDWPRVSIRATSFAIMSTLCLPFARLKWIVARICSATGFQTLN